MILQMDLKIEFEREDDGRWIAEIRDLPGVLVYGASREEALTSVQALALLVLADRLRSGRFQPSVLTIQFWVL